MTETFNGSFSMFPAREKKSEKSPDHTGTIELTIADAMALSGWLVAQPGEPNYQGEPVVKLRIAGWASESKNGLGYIRGKISAPMVQQQTSTVENDIF